VFVLQNHLNIISGHATLSSRFMQ